MKILSNIVVSIIALISICLAPLSANAADILLDFTDNTARFATSGGANLSEGDLVRIGYISNGGIADGTSDFNANLTTLETGSYADISALFVPLGESVADGGLAAGLGQPPGGFPAQQALRINGIASPLASVGEMQGEITGWLTSYLNIGERLVLLVTNNGDLGNPNPTEFGLYSSTDWLSPDPVPAIGNALVSGSDLIASEVIRGSLSSSGGTDFVNLELAVVIPEPSRALLMLFGLGAVAMRRRR